MMVAPAALGAVSGIMVVGSVLDENAVVMGRDCVGGDVDLLGAP